MIKNILVPLNGTLHSERALPYAVVMATHFQLELVLLRVVEPGKPALIESATEYLEKFKAILQGEFVPNTPLPVEVRRLVARTQSFLNSSSRPSGDEIPYTVTTRVVTGSPEDKILSCAAELQASLIFMSTRERTGLDRLLRESVAAKVVHNCNIPVMMVSPKQAPNAPLAETFRMVPPNLFFKPMLMLLNGSPLAEQALEVIKSPQPELRSPLVLLEVVPDREEMLAQVGLGLWAFYPPQVAPEDLEKEAVEYLAQMKSHCLSSTATDNTEWKVSDRVEQGAVVPAVLNSAIRLGAGAIVMASHCRTGLSRAVLGSVMDQVVRESGLPVLVVNGKAGKAFAARNVAEKVDLQLQRMEAQA
ncbi:MAG TPA: universal stress protein [Chloroflexia bacterium]|nr:universal stress protein [Chloroflexia bacterium]